MIPGYLNPLITSTGNSKDITLQNEPQKMKESISTYAEKIISQPLDEISRDEVESFIKEICILESSIQKAAVKIPISVTEYHWNTTESTEEIAPKKPKTKSNEYEKKICGRIEKATKKLFERELMALSKSISETTRSRHEDNLIFLESFMSLHHMKGTSIYGGFRENLLLKDAIKLLNKIAQKPINKITNYEVDRIVDFGYKVNIIEKGKQEYEEKIMKYEPIENPNLFSTQGYCEGRWYNEERIKQEILEDALDKLIEREEVALSNSLYTDAIERHKYNLDVLRSMKSPEI